MEDGLAVVFSRIHERPDITEPLSKSAGNGDRGFLSFEDNDLAVEWCENRLFCMASPPPDRVASLAGFPLFKGVHEALLREVEAVTCSQSYAPGERILESGQAGDGRIFFIESGQVSILVPLASGDHQRISTMGPGMNFGEMVLLGQSTRSATVVADNEVACRVLEAVDFNRLSEQTPLLKIALLENLTKDMADKLRRATQWIAALA
jgi:CRP-like cAMP-binding protein